MCVCLVRRSFNETAQYFVKKKKIFSVILEFERITVKQPAAAYIQIQPAHGLKSAYVKKENIFIKNIIMF